MYWESSNGVCTMKIRLKKQNRHEVESVNQTGIQAKSLTDIRPMDNALAAPQKPQTQEINHQQIQKKQGFNFAEIPISGNTDESAARIQPKFNLSLQKKLTVGAAGDKYEQEADSVAEKVVKKINTPSGEQSTSGQGVQRQEEEDLQMKPDISSIQRQEGRGRRRLANEARYFLNSTSGRGRRRLANEARYFLNSTSGRGRRNSS